MLLAAPLHIAILRALANGSQSQIELRRAAGSPAQTTLRTHLNGLSTLGAITKRRRDSFPGALEFELTDAGRELLAITAALERWLANAPESPLELGTDAAKAPIKALAEGWSSTILRALAAKPLSLTELDRVIGALNYPSLERRLVAMRFAAQIEARRGNGRGTPYAVTDWLRQGVAPLLAAIRWERRHLAPAGAALTRLDIEATFLLTVPLLCLPNDLCGACRMAVELSNGRKHGLAGAIVELDEGRIVSCATRLQGYPDAWISGSSSAWLATLIDADADGLEVGGDGGLARTLLAGLHHSLFEPEDPRSRVG